MNLFRFPGFQCRLCTGPVYSTTSAPDLLDFNWGPASLTTCLKSTYLRWLSPPDWKGAGLSFKPGCLLSCLIIGVMLTKSPHQHGLTFQPVVILGSFVTYVCIHRLAKTSDLNGTSSQKPHLDFSPGYNVLLLVPTPFFTCVPECLPCTWLFDLPL